MSVELAAPFNAPTTITLLPHPQLGNEEGLDTELAYDESVSGNPHTYVQRSGNKRLVLEFANVGRGKMLEVQEFVQAYAGETIRLTDHKGSIWRVVFATTNVSFTVNKKTFSSGGPRSEAGSFRLEFIGEQIL